MTDENMVASGHDDVRSQGATGPVTGTGAILLWTCPECGRRTGLTSCAHCWVTSVRVEYVPVDDAAVERAALAIHLARGLSRGSFRSDNYCECDELAVAALRAAGETS